MKVKLCYKDLKLGELTYDGDKYEYVSLTDRSKFLKEYGYIDFPLASIKSKKSKEMPYFFAELVERLIYNPAMSTKLNINLNVDNYFDILYRYAKLPQVKNTFYYIAD